MADRDSAATAPSGAVVPCGVRAVLYDCFTFERLGYLKSFDLSANGGRGRVVFTDKVADALVFPDAGAALDARNAVSPTMPVREIALGGDGRPNRPLAAFTWEMQRVDE